jgi:hypothetical protein
VAEGRFVVALKEQGILFGPFANSEDAEEFADFVTAEIDPAEVRTLNSPAAELLAWRKAMLELNRA